MKFKTLETTLSPNGVLTVKLNRPDIRNAFNAVMIDELHQVFGKDAENKKVKIVVFRGEGSNFCAGGDLAWMKNSSKLTVKQNLVETRHLSDMFRTINECTKPIIGAVHGAAIGGGVGLVSVCDYVIATTDTTFSLSEVRLGIVPACIGPFVVAKIGASHARALFISAERFQSPKAFEIGLIHEIAKDSMALDIAVERVTSNMLKAGPRAMSIAKQLVLDLTWPERRVKIKNCYEYVSKTLSELRVTPEAQEGLKAFLEKRTPVWPQ
ncbi:MAG: enoyl-CoA hydratase/isomerase family protein [Xanthomonadaceae bacterium]|nr:enoyl-CoA hydratase/isomerase family protein [Xanthomonadaceae bacterium]